ncbi:PREDICTED: vomeronasal type-1 receptor 4-like [Dipodomys ordii]|uniref:Vomeronasal type-1 receptor n=1 Tax=Dipodomys ordii TaxID=10020 RepID=A0A1S3G2P5_DIPOR|nr:PREDICTED: vomeronasal type-1 receptor 4-like [Dipodomys ordii]
MSISSTCYLNLFRAISISQGDSKWAVLKDPAANVLYVAMLSVPDVLHKQSMRHIQRISISIRASLESRATTIILLLMSTFVSFYTVSCICQNCLSVIYKPSPVLHHMSAFALGNFPALSPFLLMSRHSTPCSLLFN